MKKLSLVIVTLVAFSCMMLTSCKKDKLDGTTWTATESATEEGVTVTSTVTLAFEDGEFDITVSVMSFSMKQHGTYTYVDPKVTLTATVDGQTSSMEGTVNGDKMTLSMDGESYTLTKQK